MAKDICSKAIFSWEVINTLRVEELPREREGGQGEQDPATHSVSELSRGR